MNSKLKNGLKYALWASFIYMVFTVIVALIPMGSPALDNSRAYTRVSLIGIFILPGVIVGQFMSIKSLVFTTIFNLIFYFIIAFAIGYFKFPKAK